MNKIEKKEVLVFSNKEDVLTTSILIAEKFKKQHKNVLAKIDAIIIRRPEFARLNFKPTIREVKGPKGAIRQDKCYEVTEEGFMKLAFGFTGSAVEDMQELFIQQFQTMRKLLTKQKAKQFDLEWNAVRDIGKIARKGFTDCVLAVEELIRRQNPDSNYLKRKNAVYDAMTVAVYTGLELNTGRVRLKKIDKKANFRDSLGTRQLAILDFIEKLLPDMVKVMIVENAYYKAVMAAIKSYAQQFRSLLDAPVSGTALI